jgi:predicted amidohydrolase
MKGELDDKRTLRVASVQFESTPGDKDANFRKIEAFVEQAARQDARLIVLPECCITEYWFIRNLSVEALARMRGRGALSLKRSLESANGKGWCSADARRPVDFRGGLH